jgi:hypothetical protein
MQAYKGPQLPKEQLATLCAGFSFTRNHRVTGAGVDTGEKWATNGSNCVAVPAPGPDHSYTFQAAFEYVSSKNYNGYGEVASTLNRITPVQTITFPVSGGQSYYAAVMRPKGSSNYEDWRLVMINQATLIERRRGVYIFECQYCYAGQCQDKPPADGTKVYDLIERAGIGQRCTNEAES